MTQQVKEMTAFGREARRIMTGLSTARIVDGYGKSITLLSDQVQGAFTFAGQVDGTDTVNTYTEDGWFNSTAGGYSDDLRIVN